MTRLHQTHGIHICLSQALSGSQDVKTLDKERAGAMTCIKKQAVETSVYQPNGGAQHDTRKGRKKSSLKNELIKL